MELAAQVERGVPGMGVLIDNRPRRARAGAARKRAAPLPWLSAGGKKMCSVLLSKGGVCSFLGALGSNENILLSGQEFCYLLVVC